MRKRIFRHGFNTASAKAILTKVTTACMKALPVLVLLATSAVNPAPAAAQQCSQLATSQPRELVDKEPVNPVSDGTYTVVPSTQSPQTPQKKTSKENFVVHRTVENKTLVIVGYSTDSNKASAENYCGSLTGFLCQ